MLNSSYETATARKGAVTVLVIALMIIMLIVAVFAVDYGYILVVRADLQRAADNAALAAVQDLVPDPFGNQDLPKANQTVADYTVDNLDDEEFQVLAQDIETGRVDRESIYEEVSLHQSGVHDAVRVKLRRDDVGNSSVTLYFAKMLGIQNANVSASATAILQNGRYLHPGTDVLPIGIPIETWNQHNFGDVWTIYGNGRLIDQFGNEVPGNWGTLDIGAGSNATSAIADQILNGLRQEDLDHLHDAGKIPSNEMIDSEAAMWLSGDTGLSSGIKDAVRSSHGATKLIPIFSQLNDKANGENLEFLVVAWGAVEVVDSRWQGNQKTYIKIRKAYSYDGQLRPNQRLDETMDIIDGAFTSPVLVQ